MCIGESETEESKKMNENKTKVKGEWLYVDISYVSAKSQGGANYWALAVDKATQNKWSFFLKNKSDMVEVICDLVEELINEGYGVKFISCDNLGENKGIKKEFYLGR